MFRKLIWTAGVLILITSLGLAGCAPKSGAPQPPEIIYGQDVCDRCGMIIGEERFASATLLENGEYLTFDDTGEMLRYHTKEGDDQVVAWFVHDYNTLEWLRGEQALFVLSEDQYTPMGTGIVAFSSRAEAEKLAAENSGSVYTLTELQETLQSKPAMDH